jgi:hypothetical protein
MVFALAIGLTSPTVSFACWFTGENTYECCMVCCQDAEACGDHLSGLGGGMQIQLVLHGKSSLLF